MARGAAWRARVLDPAPSTVATPEERAPSVATAVMYVKPADHT